MELENRQRLEKNKITVVLGAIIQIYITAIALLGLLDSTASMMRVVPRAIICVLMLVVFLVGYFKCKGTPTFIYICFATMLIAYAATTLTNRNVYMYAIAYPIVGMAVLYLNRRLAQVIMALTVVINIIAGVKNYISYPDTQGESFMQMIYMVVFCIAMYIVVNQLDRHTREKADEAVRNMESSQGLAREIIANSETLVKNLDEAKEKAQLLTESMQTTNSSMCEIAESVKYTAEAIETQTIKTNNIQVNIENAEEQTGQMKDSAVDAQGAVREGVDLIMALRDKAVQTSDITKETRKNTEELGESIREVESIIATILGISEQTNLLSLNASIEAARAGEAGKGFAVVADEIRNLSDETKASTEKITEIIGKLTDNVGEASANMEKSAEFVEEQAGMIDDTKEKFEAVIEKTDFLYQTVEGITDAIGEILNANTQINDSITNLSATSEQVASSSENGTAVSEESMRALGEMNDILNRIFEISEQIKRLVSH